MIRYEYCRNNKGAIPMPSPAPRMRNIIPMHGPFAKQIEHGPTVGPESKFRNVYCTAIFKPA